MSAWRVVKPGAKYTVSSKELVLYLYILVLVTSLASNVRIGYTP
jgi:hypothetical protein